MTMESSAHPKITSLTIENFKAVRSACRVEFKPITLLFGPNSAGKSTILQAMQFMRELLERRNVDTDHTIGGGDSVDLGGFRNFAQQHDPSQPVTVRIDFSLGDVQLPTYGRIGVNPETSSDLRKDIAENGIGDVQTAWVKVTCRWNEKKHVPFIDRYEIGLNGQRIAEISADVDSPPCITDLDFDHPLFLRFDVEEEIKSPDDHGSREQLLSIFSFQCSHVNSSSLLDGVQINVPKGEGAIPPFGQHLPISDNYDEDECGDDDADLFSFLVSQILVGPGELLLRLLKGIRYLGPIRAVPPRNFMPQTSPEESRWSSGLAAWDLLFASYDHDAHTGDSFFKAVDQTLSSEDELALGYSMELSEVYEVRDDSVIMQHLRLLKAKGEGDDTGALFRIPLIRELKRLQSRRRLLLRDNVNDTDVKPQDIGAGISQVLPVVVGAMAPKCSLFAVEQPELHIHPRIQCNLGDVFAREANKDDGRIFLIETHSEHLILRLLRRIRETTEKTCPPDRPELRPDQVAVYYIKGGPEGMSAEEQSIAPDGDFARQWPDGFFEEREEELF